MKALVLTRRKRIKKINAHSKVPKNAVLWTEPVAKPCSVCGSATRWTGLNEDDKPHRLCIICARKDVFMKLAKSRLTEK